MANINTILESLPRSGIRRIADRLTEIAHSHGQVIHLGLGEPQEPTPMAIRRAVSRAALNGRTKYTPNAGYQKLRHAIQKKLSDFNHVQIDSDGIFVTPGATYGLAVAVGSLINPGDEVLVPDPGYPNFAGTVLHYGGKPVYYKLEEQHGYQPDIKKLRSLLSEKTKLMILNSPSNPTGAVLSEETIRQITDLTRQQGIWLLSDEVYEAFVFKGRHVSPLSYPDSDHVVGLYSFSKTFNMAGLRVGYLVTRSRQLQTSLIKAQELYISCAPSTSQWAAFEALTKCQKDIESLRKNFETKRLAALSFLNGLTHYEPTGAYYLMLDISKTGLTSDKFADRLLADHAVAVAPGSTFGPSGNGLIRIAFTPPKDHFEEGLKKIKRFILTL